MNCAFAALSMAGLGVILLAPRTEGVDDLKPSGGKLLIAVGDSLPGVPLGDQFHGLVLLDPENGERKPIGTPDLEGGRLSPDARFFAGIDGGGHVGIWIGDLTGKTPRKRIFDRSGNVMWSGDGKQIVISARIGRGKHETYRVNSDGSGLTKLPIPETELVTDWSRDGIWLASWNPVRTTREIHILLTHPDGTAAHEIVNEEGAGGNFRISQDGREVVFAISQGRGRKTDPFRLGRQRRWNRSEKAPVQNRRRADLMPHWSPEGSRLALGLRWNGRPPIGNSDRIMIINRDGKDARTLSLPPMWRLTLDDWR